MPMARQVIHQRRFPLPGNSEGSLLSGRETPLFQFLSLAYFACDQRFCQYDLRNPSETEMLPTLREEIQRCLAVEYYDHHSRP